jgi:hypothetical protein
MNGPIWGRNSIRNWKFLQRNVIAFSPNDKFLLTYRNSLTDPLKNSNKNIQYIYYFNSAL